MEDLQKEKTMEINWNEQLKKFAVGTITQMAVVSIIIGLIWMVLSNI